MNELETKDSFVFVAMPFGGTHSTEVYEDAIRPAVEGCGLRCKRADEIFDTDVIIESIENDIRDCLLVIADLTGRNPNVFYEVGCARSLDKEVILLTQQSDDVPFDLQHRRYIRYGTSGRQLDDLRATLQKTLNAVIPRARRTEATRHAQEVSVNVNAEVAALRAQVNTGLEDLRQELRSAAQNGVDIGDVDSPLPLFHTARLNAIRSACQSNLKQLGLAALQCAQDSEEKLPDCAQWQNALLPYIRNPVLFKCAAAPDLEFGYAMNSALSGFYLTLLEDPSRTPLFFDSSLGHGNAAGGVEALCNPPRHLGRNNIVFADGHVTTVKPEDVTSLIWTPKRSVALTTA